MIVVRIFILSINQYTLDQNWQTTILNEAFSSIQVFFPLVFLFLPSSFYYSFYLFLFFVPDEVMVTSQDTAWIVYTIVFILQGIVLGVRSRHNLLLLPFVVFTLLSAVGHIIMIERNYQGDTLVLLADRSVITNHMPIFSFLLYAGIIGCQLVCIQNSTANSHVQQQPPSPSSSKDATSEKQQHRLLFISRARLGRRPPMYWVIISHLLAYGCLVLAFICVRVTRDDDLSATRRSLASLVTSMLGIIVSNSALLYWFTFCRQSISIASRTSKQHYYDTWLVRIIMFLYLVFMTGMATEAWLFYGMLENRHVNYHLSAGPGSWIALETTLVYLPIYIILGILVILRCFRQLSDADIESPNDTGSSTTATGPRSLRFLWRSRNNHPHRHLEEDTT